MSDSTEDKNDHKNNPPKFENWGDIRKLLILILILVWLVEYYLCIEHVDKKTFVVLASLVFVYIFDHIYSIALSAKASEFFKSFLFQTAVPLTALSVVALLAYSRAIDSQATITMFGLALAYTTFVVGKRLKPEPENQSNQQNAPTK
ncbi:MAG: hypothetical protein PHC94_11005 [Methylobacter sp.]|nr:hypothetical protein [Methylobacter sp.]